MKKKNLKGKSRVYQFKPRDHHVLPVKLYLVTKQHTFILDYNKIIE